MKPLQLISFRRSGNHLLKETLKVNFNVPITKYTIAHPWPDLHTAVLLDSKFTLLYIVRDGREVMASLYNFLKESSFRKWDGVQVKIANNFSDFLLGKNKVVDCWCPNMRLMFENPALSWARHTLWIELPKHNWFKTAIRYIKFENLVLKPEKTILKISENFNWPLKNKDPIPIRKLVGPTVRKGSIAGWKREFSDMDLEYFWKYAGERMKKFGYKE